MVMVHDLVQKVVDGGGPGVVFCFPSFPLGLEFSRIMVIILVVVVVILFGICWLIHRYCYLLAAKRPLRSLWFLQNFQVCQCMHT